MTNPITLDRFDAVLFDLDGVLTATANLHALCWKKMFDDFLKRRAAERKEPFFAFDIGSDYTLYVDGKPRYEGVRSFLESRGIEMPSGTPDAPPDEHTVCGLGNRKNQMFNRVLDAEGIEAYAGSVALVRHLRSEGIKTAVVSSSKNSEAILRAAGIRELFALRVDGEVAARLTLRGKPAPDTFLKPRDSSASSRTARSWSKTRLRVCKRVAPAASGSSSALTAGMTRNRSGRMAPTSSSRTWASCWERHEAPPHSAEVVAGRDLGCTRPRGHDSRSILLRGNLQPLTAHCIGTNSCGESRSMPTIS